MRVQLKSFIRYMNNNEENKELTEAEEFCLKLKREYNQDCSICVRSEDEE